MSISIADELLKELAYYKFNTANAQFVKEDFGGQNEELDNYIGQIIRGCLLMQDMVKDVLAYSKFSASAEKLVPVDLNEIFSNALDILSNSIEETGGSVTSGNLPTVLGVKAQLSQVFQNLIANGLKYHAAEPPEVRVSAKRAGDNFEIIIRDKGIGIAPEHQETVFEIFKRLQFDDFAYVLRLGGYFSLPVFVCRALMCQKVIVVIVGISNFNYRQSNKIGDESHHYIPNIHN